MNTIFDLTAPGAIDRLLAHHRSVFGETRMELPEGSTDPNAIVVPIIPEPVVHQERQQGFNEEEFLKSPAVEALLARARKEEKDKLYPQLESLKGDLSELKSDRDNAIKAAGEKARKEAEAAAQIRLDEMSAKDLVAETRTEFEQRIAQMEAERATERAVYAKEAEFRDLRDHTKTVVAEALENNEIAPELAHMVVGNNLDEVNASLENVKATSAEIAKNVAAALQGAAAPVAPVRGVSSTGYAPNGPLEQATGTRSLSPADITNMSMAEFAKLRPALGVDRSSGQRGLFG